MLPVTPPFLPVPFAASGIKNTIPAESPGATQPNASWELGFPQITMVNRQAGGLPPLGQDFNGVLNALSQHAFFGQSGCVYPWQGADASTGFPGLNYLVGSHVLGSDMCEYIAVQPSGPDVPASGGYVGPQDPVTDTGEAYWMRIDVKLEPFTSPTATEPGGQGLVPAPPAMPDASQLLTFLSAMGWGSFSTAFVSKDYGKPDYVTAKELFAGSVQINSADANTCTAGAYHSENWSNAPGTTGLLVTLPLSLLNDSVYSLIQLFFSYTGAGSYRTTLLAGIPSGTQPTASDWDVWTSFNAPTPHLPPSDGTYPVGSMFGIESLSSYTVPPGGTWVVDFMGRSISEGVPQYYFDILPGGSTIVLAPNIYDWVGWLWRIA